MTPLLRLVEELGVLCSEPDPALDIVERVPGVRTPTRSRRGRNPDATPDVDPERAVARLGDGVLEGGPHLLHGGGVDEQGRPRVPQRPPLENFHRVAQELDGGLASGTSVVAISALTKYRAEANSPRRPCCPAR